MADVKLPIPMAGLREEFRQGKNILRLLREAQGSEANTAEAVLAAYDLQAGAYVGLMSNPNHYPALLEYASAIARLLDSLKADSILEAGVGEATTLTHVVASMAYRPRFAAGFDFSWSRVAHGKAYAARHGLAPELFVGDMFAIPAIDGAVDVVYTSHTIEPNRGREKEALKELYRVTHRFLVLLEPALTLGNEATKQRIARHGYCTQLQDHAHELGYNVKEHRLFDVHSQPDLQSEMIVIEKASSTYRPKLGGWSAGCPRCRYELMHHKGHLYCDRCCLIFPVIDGIPCLLPDVGVLGSHFLSF